MKPLIWFDFGGWNCCLNWRDWNAVWGFGDSPTDAYLNWLANVKNASQEPA